MKNKSSSRLLALLLISIWVFQKSEAQTTQKKDVNCDLNVVGGTIPSQAFFNYGNVTNMRSSTRRTNLTIGQLVVGEGIGNDYNSNFGYWGRLLVAPLPPTVVATQGELGDRIQISWTPNVFGAAPVNGFKIYRDGVFLAAVDKSTRNYNDFNVIAGKNYEYEVRGINLYGEGPSGEALGFQVPNGVVTGWVRTLNGTSVPDALVALSPMQGYALKFGAFDGAVTRAESATNNHFFPTSAATDWTMTFWMKTTGLANSVVDIFRLSNNGMAFRTNASFFTAELLGASLSANYPTAVPTDWFNVAITFSGGQYRLYLNGELKDLKNGSAIAASPELVFGANTPFAGWLGSLDEFRIYHRRLDELDFQEVMRGTASSLTPGLKYYWKMDEGAGTKCFDILRRSRLFLCGSIFDSNRPPVATSSVTDSDGYYRIEGANYGNGTTFLASPKKDFYKYKALKFLKNEGDYALLPDFLMPEKATLEMWVNPSELTGNEVFLHKTWGAGGSNFFLLQNFGGTIRINLNGSSYDFGTLNLGYQHLAVTLERTPTNTLISVFKNGQISGSPVIAVPTTGDWSEPGQNWVVGALKGLYGVPAGQYGYFFGGLVDEIAVYDTIFNQSQIQVHSQNARDPQEKNLKIYFAFDEGAGLRLSNSGSTLVDGTGTLPATTGKPEWTILTKFQETTPHVFSPATRQVTLNPSVTSVDQVDFTDRSTVAISGFVRYANTDCFQQNVEILVNDESFDPPIFTDSTGKFVVDLEPGSSVVLRPQFGKHTFMPEEIELSNVVAPVAGLVFNNTVVRKISGLVAGGDCKQNVFSQNSSLKVVVRSTDGCFYKDQVLNATTGGDYEFENLPPIEMTVGILDATDPSLGAFFDAQGGRQVDLTSRDTVVEFLYHSEPQVLVEGLDSYKPQNCTEIVLPQNQIVTLTIKVKENYAGGSCDVDTADLRINDDWGLVALDTTLSKGQLVYKLRVGVPNPTPPYLKTFQVVATTVDGAESDQVIQAVVTGLRQKSPTFTTKLADMPTLVLRDPPGDGSYAFIEKDEQHCTSFEVATESSIGPDVAVSIDLGPKTSILFGAIDVETLIKTDFEFHSTVSKTKSNAFEVCRSAKQRISTDDGDLIVGEQGGDLYMGLALNVGVGYSDIVSFDAANCAVNLGTTLTVSPQDYATTYIYSEWNIKENVIRYLSDIIADIKADPAKPDADTLVYSQSRKNWLDAIAKNKKAKKDAVFSRNISWDAGVSYEYSETIDTAIAVTTGTSTIESKQFAFTLGAYFAGVGGEFSVGFTSTSSDSKTKTNGTTKSTTTGFVFKDDDPLDAFSVDVKHDPIYKTPVFYLKYGQTSCPWEPHSAKREGVLLTSVDGPVRLDVPSNEPAVYKFILGNTSATQETWTYSFSAGPESNPDGAKIFLNGAALDHPVFMAIPYGTSVPATITLERGQPDVYEYDDLEIVLYSLCEDTRANALGILPDTAQDLYSAIYITAHFIKPCSEIAVNVPQEGWAITTPKNNHAMPITISGYNKDNSDFERARVQYRRKGGDGIWINIPKESSFQEADGSILRDSLDDGFTTIIWDSDGLGDGDYEIRAVAECGGDLAGSPGISRIISGKIDRQAPSLIGLPQPSDGVYQVGDEISFTFNQDINCQKINALDNVLLFDATTDLPINIDISCKDNQIFLDPRFDNNSFFENKIFRAELHDIEDLTGNLAENPIQAAFPSKFGWEFYVDRNELAWLTDSVGMTKNADETKTVAAKIHNRGGYPVPFEIQDVPSWVRVVPNVGTLAPNEIREIRFEVDSILPIGHWFDTIVLHTNTGQNPFFMGGDEGLPFGVRVVCRAPDWDFDPKNFTNSMNMVLQLNIGGNFSSDPEDMVVAWLDNKIVGRANLEFVPQTNSHLVFLTIYGQDNQISAPLRLEIWDASACLRFEVLENSFTFQPDNVIGNPTTPQILTTTLNVLRDVPIGTGWNWLSFNLAFPNPNLNPALASLSHPTNDLIKSQTQFSTYSGGSWLGSLASLDNKKMYIYRADTPDKLVMKGTLINPATTPISLTSGWNWIGYLPNYPLPINDALSSLNPTAGDLIKSQTEFAQFINPTFGWLGNLKFLEAPQGYQIKLANAGVLTYPTQANKVTPTSRSVNPSRDRTDQEVGVTWEVDASKFEHSTTLIGILKTNGANATSEKMELGAFVGGEVRGAAQAIFIEPLDAYVFFLTAYSNKIGEQLNFKIFDATTGAVQDLNEKMEFAANQHQGSLEAPVPFTLKTSAAGEATVEQSFDIQPNPLRTETLFKFSLPESQEVVLSVVNLNGKTISEERFLAAAGLNARLWRADLSLESGVYFVRLETSDGTFVRKILFSR